MTVEVALLGASAMPFVAYGVAGVWKHLTKRPREPKVLLDERYARGEMTRRLRASFGDAHIWASDGISTCPA